MTMSRLSNKFSGGGYTSKAEDEKRDSQKDPPSDSGVLGRCRDVVSSWFSNEVDDKKNPQKI